MVWFRCIAFSSCALVSLGDAFAGDPIYTVAGDGSGVLPGFGYSVANAGDVDADGVADLIAGAPYEGPAHAGAAKLLSGATGALLLPPLTGAEARYYGFSVAGVGDVNGDGILDVAIGDPEFGGISPGKQGYTDVRSSADGSLLRHVSGLGIDDDFGWSVSAAGDVNLDGFPDWVVGAIETSDFTPGNGYARVLSGATGALLFHLTGGGPLFGSDVEAAGDVDLDGRPDVLVGRGGGAGGVQLRSGATGTALWSKVGPTGSQFGWSLAAAGDVDADGTADVAVGAPGKALARVLRLTDGAQVLTLAGPASSNFGTSVAGPGDVDGDGHADLVVGAKWASDGATFSTGAAFVHSGRDGSLFQSYFGAATSDFYGFAVAALGDVDGDGFGDAAIGATQEGVFDPGYVEVRPLRPALVGDVGAISLASGGTQALSLDAGSGAAGASYLVLGSASGTAPGTVVQGRTIPLNVDAYFLFTATAPGAPVVGGFGTLDGAGRAAAAFVLPAGLSPTFAGLAIHHAFVAFAPASGAIVLASNAVAVALEP